MRPARGFYQLPLLAWLLLSLAPFCGRCALRDGGIDPWNLGKGDWTYSITDATNKLGGHITSVTNETSLMLFYKSQGIRYMIVKAGTSDRLFNGCYGFPQFSAYLVNTAHANGILIFGYNRSFGSNVVGEIAVSDFVFHQGADGFVWDAEAEWEAGASHPWITNASAQAWQLCSGVRSNWPAKFLAHAPLPIIGLHTSFPYKEFGYWCDAVMPQIYHFSSTGLKRSPSACINWSDVNWSAWQNSLNFSSVVNGQTVYWTNSIKPLTPLQDVYGPIIPGGVICESANNPYPDKDVLEFIDYAAADPHAQTVGGYQGANFWSTDLHSAVQWANIGAGTSGNFPGIVNNIVIDEPNASVTGAWTAVKVFGATTTTPTYYGATGTDTNSFGTNYLTHARGSGTNYVQYAPNVIVPGDYNLYEWHPYRSDASASVPFLIFHHGNTNSVYANQQTNSGNWSLLGKFNFLAGFPVTVRVTDAIAESDKVALVDGLKLVFVPPSSLPAAPARLRATAAGTSQIDLAWIDTSTNATAFVIARSTISGGPYTNVATVAAVPTAYSDTGLTDNTTYYYVVRAANFLGASGDSGPAFATTLARSPVRCVGDNSWGQLDVPSIATNVIAIASGAWHILALRADGTIVAWGDNIRGQCDVPEALTDALAIAAGGDHSLAIRSNGKVIAWGSNDDGESDVPAKLDRVIAISGGVSHSLALRDNGTVVAWGGNTFGQASVPTGLSNVVAIAAGGYHSLALRADGSVAGWGANTATEGGFTGQATVPWNLTNGLALAAGDYHSLALLKNGTVLAWGDSSQDQCSVPAGLSNVAALAGGGAHSLALRQDGSVVAWGAIWSGQCNLPADLNEAIAVAAGANHSLVLETGTVPAALLLNPSRQGNRFTSLAQTLNRRNYALLYVNFAGSTNWTALSTNSGNGALRLLTDPTATGARRFYRMRQW